MFKAQTLRRSFSLFRRIPTSTVISTAARHGHENVQIQRVRFKQPFLTHRRLVGATLALVCFYTFSIKLDRIIPDLEEEAKGEKDDGAGSALFFFPTGLSRPKKREYYRGSDPEWQEFVQLSHDRVRLAHIRKELAANIRHFLARDPVLVRDLGKINTKSGQNWFEVSFPDGPPIEFERPGYELTNELTLRKTTRPVEPFHHKRLSRIVTPTITATSLFEDTKRRAVRSWVGFKTYLGWKADSTAATPQAPTSATNPPTSSSPKPPPSGATPPSTGTVSSTDNISKTDGDSSTAAPPSRSSSSSTSSPSSSPTTPSSNPIIKLFDSTLLEATLPPENLPKMNLNYFRYLFRKYTVRPSSRPIPPRGSILVLGLVEAVGEKGKATFDVACFYNISTAQFSLVYIKPWNVVAYKQVPRGGN